MEAEALALAASLLTALSSVLATRGMQGTHPDTANLTLTGTQTLVLTLLLLRGFQPPNPLGALWLAASGLLASYLGRLITLKSYHQIGVSTSSAIVGTSPLFTALLAITLLGERPTPPVLAGSTLVAAGIALLNLEEGPQTPRRRLYLPLAAALLFATANLLRKMGTNLVPDSLLAAQISTLTGLAAALTALAAQKKLGPTLSRAASPWLIAAGTTNAGAWIALTASTSLGEVSRISAIVYSYPLFTLILARNLLGEGLTKRQLAGCLATVAGVTAALLL